MSMFRGCVFEVEGRERVRKWVHMEGVVCMLARVDGWCGLRSVQMQMQTLGLLQIRL